MVKRGHKNYQTTSAGNTKGQIHRAARIGQTKQSSGQGAGVSHSRAWPEDYGREHYASAAIIEETKPAGSFAAELDDELEGMLEDEREWQHMLPVTNMPEQTALASIDLNPLYEAVAEMQERIREAEKSLKHSKQARQMLKKEMETATKLAAEAEDELTAAAKKAAYLKHEAEHVCNEGQILQRQLSAEEQSWQQKLQEELQMLAETEKKLRIAEDEAQRINHAKEVAARMNERDLWRLGSSKQGLWLQRRKTQGNALPMTREKSSGWQAPKAVTSPGATYTQSVLEQEQRYTQKRRDEDDNPQRLSMLSESAQALAERQSSQLEEELLAQLAEQEAARHLSEQAELLAADKTDIPGLSADILEALYRQGILHREQAPPERRETATALEAPYSTEAVQNIPAPPPQAVQNIPAPPQPVAQSIPAPPPQAAQNIPAPPPQAVQNIPAPPQPVAQNIPAPPLQAAQGAALNTDILQTLYRQGFMQAPAELRKTETPPPYTPPPAPPVEMARPIAVPPLASPQTGPENADSLHALQRQEAFNRGQTPAAQPETAAANLAVLQPQPALNTPAPPTAPPPQAAPYISATPPQSVPQAVDPLQFLAMRAAQGAAAAQPSTAIAEDTVPYSESQQQLTAATARLHAQEAVTAAANEEDIQQLARQANMLAHQHLARQHADNTLANRAAITQRVAEETGGQDHLLKEQQMAERAIAAAMAAAKKAAQSAIAISEQASQHMPKQEGRAEDENRYYSAERLIADALSKAAVANQHQK